MCQPNNAYNALELIRKRKPLVQNITNYVVMNNTANALLSVGASPIMAHSVQEMEEMVGIVNALVINIGTLSDHWIEGMKLAIKTAVTRQIPIVIDPVGVGATSYRTNTAHQLLKNTYPLIIRGNASEIMALYQSSEYKSKGVDSLNQSEEAIAAAQELSELHQCVVSVSGETDYIVEGDRIMKVMNGDAMMPLVTGLGCTASAITGAFAAVCSSRFEAAVYAMLTMGIAGEIAKEKAEGPASLQMYFLDALYNLQETDYVSRAKLSLL